MIDPATDIVRQLNYQFSGVVGRGGLAGQDHCACHPALAAWPGRVGQHRLIAGHHVQQVQQLPLVFVDALDLHVEHRGRIDGQAKFALDGVGQPLLVALLDCGQRLLQFAVPGVCRQLLQLVGIATPFRADLLVEQGRQPGIALHQPAARRDAIGHVAKALRKHAGEVGKNGIHHQLRVQFGHPVDPMRGDDGQGGHSHPPFTAFVDQRTMLDQSIIVWMLMAQSFKMPMIDLVDDFEVAWQQPFKHPHRPGFQRFRHQRVVGIADRLPSNGPGRGPAQAMQVEQNTHQFRRRQRRMGIVEVDGVVQA